MNFPIFNIPLTPMTVGASVTGTTSKTALASCVIKGGTMNLNAAFMVEFSYSMTNNANNKVLEVEFGSTNFMSTTESSQSSRQLIKMVQNRNSLSSQVSYRLSEVSSYGTSASALVTMTENTANDITVTAYATLTNTGDTVTLNYFVPILILGVT